MELFCWVKGDIVPVEECFACDKIETCKQYIRFYDKSAPAVDSLRKRWDEMEPELELIIRRKKMEKNPTAEKGIKKPQLYFYTFKPLSKEENAGESESLDFSETEKKLDYAIGTEEDIVKLYLDGGKVEKIHKVGDEMEVSVKIQKKTVK